MGKARNLAKLAVDANGDVAAASLDNVPPSNDASALTTGTLPIARIADGDITAAKLGSGVAATNLGTGNVTAAMLAGTLDLTGKTVTLPSGTGGKVLQVVVNEATGTTYANYAIQSNGRVGDWDGIGNTHVSAAITTISGNSKILVFANAPLGIDNNAWGAVGLFNNTTGACIATYAGNGYSADASGCALSGYQTGHSASQSITYALRAVGGWAGNGVTLGSVRGNNTYPYTKSNLGKGTIVVMEVL